MTKSLAIVSLMVFTIMPSHSFAQDPVNFSYDDEGYVLNAANDISLTLTALLTTGIGDFLYSQMQEPDDRHKKSTSDLLIWDRKFAGRYSGTADFMSDVGSLFAIAPFAIGGIAWHAGLSDREQFGTFSLMLVQSLLFQHGINMAFRSMEIWPRPYIFSTHGEGAEKAKNAKPEAYGSFFSEHASAAFTIAVFTSEWYDQTFKNPDAARVVRALAFSLAGFESALRVAAGKHYPSDVLVGALMGTGISYGILEMHKKRNQKFSLWVSPGTAGITFRL